MDKNVKTCDLHLHLFNNKMRFLCDDTIISDHSYSYTIILCCPCYMPKYVPRLEGIMHDPKVSCSCSTCVIRCVTIKRHKHQSNSYRFRSHRYTDCIADLVIPKGSHIYIYLLTFYKTIFFTLIIMFVSHS